MEKFKELLDALNKEKRELVERMEAILKTSDDEKRELTAEEQTEYDAKDKRLDEIDVETKKTEAEISKREKLAQQKR